MEPRELYEKALAVNKQGTDLFDAIEKGEEPFEKYEEAEKLIAEAGALMDQANTRKTAEEQRAFLEEGIGSLTAASHEDDDDEVEEQPRWASFKDFTVAVAAMGNPHIAGVLREKKLLPEDWETKLLQEAVGAAGGFLVPIEYRAELFAKAYEKSIVRPRATVIPMTTRQVQMPSLDQTGTPSAPKSAFMGGMQLFWTEEGAAKTETDLDFKLIDLVVHKYAAILEVTNELIADSAISLEALIRARFGLTTAAYEDWHFLNGSGVGQPQGVISAGCTVQPNRAGAGAIVWSDIMEIIHAFQPGANGVWVAHICTMEELLQLKDANNNYMWIPNMRDAMPERLLGYPIIFTEKVPYLGTKGDIGLYDFKYYLIGDREQPSIDSSPHEKFRYDRTVFRLSARVDGKPWLSAPVKLMPAGTWSISPFVDLDVPAA